MNKKEKDTYFKRLKTHPGLPVAIAMTVLFICAAVTNKSVLVWWHGVLFGLFGSLLIWTVIFISNIKK